MDQHLRKLLILAVLVSFIISSSADQIATSSDEDASRDSHTEGVCIPGTGICTSPPVPDRVHKLAEEATTEDDTSKSGSFIICNPFRRTCHGPHTGNSDFVYNLLGISGNEEASNCEPLIICDPITKLCKRSQTNSVTSKPTKEAFSIEDSLIVCNPKTHKCTVEKYKFYVSESDKAAQIEEDSSDLQPKAVCNPITHLCQGPHTRNSDTTDSPVDASGKEDESKFKPLNVCDPKTKVCNGPQTSSVTSEPTEEALPEADTSKLKPVPINFSDCDPHTHKCHDEKKNSFVSESDKAAQIEDGSVIGEEEERISLFVCNPGVDGTLCQGNHHNFGVAQPRDEVA